MIIRTQFIKQFYKNILTRSQYILDGGSIRVGQLTSLARKELGRPGRANHAYHIYRASVIDIGTMLASRLDIVTGRTQIKSAIEGQKTEIYATVNS